MPRLPFVLFGYESVELGGGMNTLLCKLLIISGLHNEVFITPDLEEGL